MYQFHLSVTPLSPISSVMIFNRETTAASHRQSDTYRVVPLRTRRQPRQLTMTTFLSMIFFCSLALMKTNAFAPIHHSPSISGKVPIVTTSALFTSPFAGSTDDECLSNRRVFLIHAIAGGVVSIGIPQFSLPAFANEGNDESIDPSIDLPKITQKVYLDIKFGNYKPTRLIIGLFGEVMPRAVENFQTLCANGSYTGTSFYRVISEMSIQGGAIGPNSVSGKSGTSAFDNGAPFAPDNYKIKHTKKGLVSAVRGVNGDIDSRFFVQTESDAGWADNRYAVFGIVLNEGDEDRKGGGMELVRKISKVNVKPPQNVPKDPVMIVGCGLVQE
mmetsp:Transcript_21275/g.42642  ORF Transcript_21275/g.42642 Transcript_21275/m.42642 type:complete len:330 (+) Transcript_21275:31-1020(+)